MLWECSFGHVWEARFGNIKNRKSWCPKCSVKSRTKKRAFNLEYIKNFVKDKGYCLSGEYVNSNQKLIWKCFCGNVWSSTFSDVKRKKSWCRECAKKKREETCLEKYGVRNVSQNVEIQKKQTGSMNDVECVNHWKTKRKLQCRGAFEKLTVEFWNRNNVDFEWQIPFKMPSGRVYIVDAYLPEEDKYIEIKGRFLKNVSKMKWEWFHEAYPNSELWTMDVLIDKGIFYKSYYYHKNKRV